MKRLISREYATRRRPKDQRISKKTPDGRTLDHLTIVDKVADRYRYYHATKGWRDRRIVRMSRLRTVLA